MKISVLVLALVVSAPFWVNGGKLDDNGELDSPLPSLTKIFKPNSIPANAKSQPATASRIGMGINTTMLNDPEYSMGKGQTIACCGQKSRTNLDENEVDADRTFRRRHRHKKHKKQLEEKDPEPGENNLVQFMILKNKFPYLYSTTTEEILRESDLPDPKLIEKIQDVRFYDFYKGR